MRSCLARASDSQRSASISVSARRTGFTNIDTKESMTSNSSKGNGVPIRSAPNASVIPQNKILEYIPNRFALVGGPLANLLLHGGRQFVPVLSLEQMVGRGLRANPVQLAYVVEGNGFKNRIKQPRHRHSAGVHIWAHTIMMCQDQTVKIHMVANQTNIRPILLRKHVP